MQVMMTITLSDDKPCPDDQGHFICGDQVTILYNPDQDTFAYRFHGVDYTGRSYQGKVFGGFDSKQAALKAAIEYYSKGLKC